MAVLAICLLLFLEYVGQILFTLRRCYVTEILKKVGMAYLKGEVHKKAF
jgi:hypothetical protein